MVLDLAESLPRRHCLIVLRHMLTLSRVLRVCLPAFFFASLMVLAGCATTSTGVPEGAAKSPDYSAGYPNADIPVLIRARRAAESVVEANSSGRPRTDLAELRDTACRGRRNQALIFYQMVVSKQWHYYWLCSELNPRRASTREGGQSLRRFVDALTGRAQTESASCASGARRKLFGEKHESGIRANAYCDGKIVLTYPDGGRSERQFSLQQAASAVGSCPSCPSVPSVPPCQPCRASTRECPACAQCPPARVCPSAPRCPAPRSCPPQKPRATADCRSYGQAAFGQGVRKACSAFCPLMYKRCRRVMGKQSAICHQLQEYCEAKCCANFCK